MKILQFFKDCFDKNKTNVSDEFTIKTSGGSVRFIEIFVSPLVQESSAQSRTGGTGPGCRGCPVAEHEEQKTDVKTRQVVLW